MHQPKLIAVETVLVSCFVALLICAGLSACAGNGGPAPSLAPDTAGLPDTSTAAQVSEILELPTPEGVDEQTFAMLKKALVAMVESLDGEREVSAVPAGASGRVRDLQYWQEDHTLQWTYVNDGDYDQNGMVGVTDLTPVGYHYGSRAGDADWEAASVADGNGDGYITVADLTPIGRNYGHFITGYEVYLSASHLDHPEYNDGEIGDEAVYLGQQRLANSAAGRLHYEFDVADWGPHFCYWVMPGDGEELGCPSNITGGNPDDWPLVEELTPAYGQPGTEVTITGVRFGESQDESTLQMDGTDVPVLAWSDTEITAVIPSGVRTAPIRVQVGFRYADTSVFIVGEPPQISGVSPMHLRFGEPLTVFGAGFGDHQGAGLLMLDGEPHRVTSWSNDRIEVDFFEKYDCRSSLLRLSVLAANGLESAPVYLGGDLVNISASVTPQAGRIGNYSLDVTEFTFTITPAKPLDNYTVQLIPDINDMETRGGDFDLNQPGFQYTYPYGFLSGDEADVTTAFHFSCEATGHEFVMEGPVLHLVSQTTPYIAEFGVFDFNRMSAPAPNDFCYVYSENNYHDFSFINGKPWFTSAFGEIEIDGQTQPSFTRDISRFKVGEANSRPYSYRYFASSDPYTNSGSITVIHGGPFGEVPGKVWLDAGPGGQPCQVLDLLSMDGEVAWTDNQVWFYMPPGPQHMSGRVKVVRADGTEILSSMPLVCSAYVSHMDMDGELTTAGGNLTVAGYDLCPPEIPGMTGTDVYSIWYVQVHYISPWTGCNVYGPALLVTPLPAAGATDTAVEFDLGGLDPDGDGKAPVEVFTPSGDESVVIDAELIQGEYYFFLWTGALGEGPPQQIADSGIFSEAYSVYVHEAD